ncbi:DUF4188 domain-containing protein [Radiobacillus deserti]|uniref:DUF4188 domain-containing protein n=1 Tax=Radiobacillus deserti TaxID=2594883 RepID=A0A516KEN9_9BACI|nr:DUF4188 domain-containing protein [Radiobacillus deserti]QDP39859.1 DUF4188 domain-containing protein [Radiobacillus deserti]
MKQVNVGRFTTGNENDLVVFVIGMRINQWWAIHKWLPVLLAMPPMIKELYTNKQLGFHSLESFPSFRTTFMIQYWRTSEDLLAYARGNLHLTAWKKFNQLTRNNPSVGVYHETYLVPKGQYESVYVNMPLFGLSRVKQPIALTPETTSADKRLKGTEKAAR